jgi:hypothetical protein
MVKQKLFSTVIYLVASLTIGFQITYGYARPSGSANLYVMAGPHDRRGNENYIYARGSYSSSRQANYGVNYSRTYVAGLCTNYATKVAYQFRTSEKVGYPTAKEDKYSVRYSAAYLRGAYQNQNSATVSYSTGRYLPEYWTLDRMRTETIKSIAWQWDNNPVSVLNAMQAWSDDRDSALTKLKAGQSQNKNAQRLYEVAAEKLTDFWHLVFYTNGAEARFADLESGLVWQSKNDWNSLAKSWKAWKAKQEIQAYYFLLWGQRNNPKALNSYRACWSNNRYEVMSRVGKIVEH